MYLTRHQTFRGPCWAVDGRWLPDAFHLDMRDLPLRLTIERAGATVFDGETRTSRLKRSLEEIAKWLFAELDFPEGAFLMTGTGLVPPDEFTLMSGDAVRIALGDLVLDSTVG